MLPNISIIIPCYNSGKYLLEAIESVKAYPDKNVYEIIIINDGSTEPETIKLLGKLTNDYLVLHQKNQGPAAARNAGIQHAQGEYLLFLDSDNKIVPDYISKGIDILNSNKKIGIVHAVPIFFGQKIIYRFSTQEFEMSAILQGNYIDMCSIIRKEVWKDLGGLDENRLLVGHEDWEFWIRAGIKGISFYFLNESLFYYRVRENSLIDQACEPENHEKFIQYLYSKHYNIFHEKYREIFKAKFEIQNSYLHIKQQYIKDVNNPFRSFFKYMYYKYLKDKSYLVRFFTLYSLII